MALHTMVEAINMALEQEMKKDKSVIILGEDVGKDGGVFRVTEGLFDKFGEKRVIDTPLAESGIIGSSIGLSIYGFKPVAEIQFFGFIYEGFSQIVDHATRMRNRSRGLYTCPMVIRTPYGIGIKALEHHSESTEAYFIHTPGIKVVMPGTPYDAKGLLASAIRDPDPVLFLESTRLYRSIKEEVPEEEYLIPLGKAKLVQEGNDVTVVAWGSMLRTVMKAMENYTDQSIEVIDLRTVSPLDMETILNSVQKTGRLVVVQEAPRTLGLASEISAQVSEKSLLNLKAPVERVTGFDIIPPLPKGEHLYMVNEDRVLAGIKKVMSF